MSNRVNLSRRNLFNRRTTHVNRPPWVKEDIEFTDLCSRCDKCIQACETQIIVKGSGGFPEISFNSDECTFCKRCVEACPEPIFGNTSVRPWLIVAQVDESCLVNQGVMCQSCKDACDYGAIKFPPALGKPAFPSITIEDCTGCGACVAPCPNDSIKIEMPKN